MDLETIAISLYCYNAHDFSFTDRDVSRGVTSPMLSNLQEGQKLAMLQESWPRHFLWPFFVNNSWTISRNAPPPTESVSAIGLGTSLFTGINILKLSVLVLCT